MNRTLLILLALIGANLATLFAKPVPAIPLDGLIEQLGDTNPAKLREVSHKLQLLGDAAVVKLQAAAKSHANAGVRARAADLVKRIERGEIATIGTPSNYWFNRVAFAPDNQHILATGGAVIAFDLATGKEVRRDLELQFARLGFALSADGKAFATGHQYDRVIRIGEVKTGKVTQTLQGHTGGVHAVAFSPKADRLLSGSLDKSLRLWDLKTGKEIRQFPGIADQVRSVDYSPDGKQALSGHFGPGSQFPVCVWDVDAGKEIRKLKGHSKDVSAVYFLPDGKGAVTAAMDGAAIIWDIEQGKELRRMNHNGGIYGAALSPDGKRLLTAGFGDMTVRLWDIGTGRELKSYPGHGAAALGVAFSSDGRLALSCDARATVRVWQLPR
jgi:WD40 repeat protein